MSEVLSTYWIEIPCKDEESARKVAETLKGFEPRISVHKVVRKNGELSMEYETLENEVAPIFDLW